MKKIIFILVMCLGFTAFAQQVTFPKMAAGSVYQEVTTDYTLTNAVARTFTFIAPQQKPCTQDLIVHLDSLTGNHTAVSVALYGQKSALKNDSTIIGAAVIWTGLIGANPDTTIVISNATANRYRNYKLHVKGTGTATTRMDVAALKLYLE